MIKSIFLLILTFQLYTSFCQSGYWQQQVNYIIDVSLNDKNNTLDGFEKLTYINNSPDTLHYIWFHLWPNAYKNDRTAFSDQMLQHGNTKFYFSPKEQKGYINKLDFKVNGVACKTEDHPQHIDIIKLLLPAPLIPNQQITITTPFHVKLPFNFSRGGYDRQTYQLTQWYPKPAVYDAQGWHEMPYLDQGEYYSDFGNYDVRITIPQDYVVAATGELQNTNEKQWLKTRFNYIIPQKKKVPLSVKPGNSKGKTLKKINPSPEVVNNTVTTKTIQFIQNNVHDFALFANKDFIVNYDTCQLPSGKVVEVQAYYTPSNETTWQKAVTYSKDALRFYSSEVGEYPYNVVTVVQGPESFGGGMEYPTIALISPGLSALSLDATIAHEIGHNWFQGILATNERKLPWMDEGMNSFYEKKYLKNKYGSQTNGEGIIFQTLSKIKRDQPIETSSENFNTINYSLISYYKAAQLMKLLESKLGSDRFRSIMQQYYDLWKFKHPAPEDFKALFVPHLQNETDETFDLLGKKGDLPVEQLPGLSVVTPFGHSIKNYLKNPVKNLLLLSPAAGYNNYDKVMIGALVSNYKLPPSTFQFIAVPLYATGSKKLNGLGKIDYSIYPDKLFSKVNFGIGASMFSKKRSLDSNDVKVFERFQKITPSVRLYFHKPMKSTLEKWIEARSFLISEDNFSKFVTKSTDGLNYVDSSKKENRYVNQLSYSVTDSRALYPYDYLLQAQQGKGFYRVNFTGNYFFNYANGGGAGVRLFVSKFGYFNKTSRSNFSTFIYQPKLLGITGEEDFTYSNYFIGRTASYANDASVDKNNGLAAQQIMIRDGAFKLRLDQYEFLQGRSDDWVAALNLNTSLPDKLFPIKLPLMIFLDIGSFAEAWSEDANTSKFLYVGGLQLSILKGILNVYAPIIYSSDFRENLKSSPEQNKFSRKITFSLDIHRLTHQKIMGQPFHFD